MKQISIKLPEHEYKLLQLLKNEISEQMNKMFGNSMKIITATDIIKYCIATTYDLHQMEKNESNKSDN